MCFYESLGQPKDRSNVLEKVRLLSEVNSQKGSMWGIGNLESTERC